MHQPYIALLGKFHVGPSADQPISGLDGQKCRELLAYLLLQRRTPNRREQLAVLFWPDSSAHTARKYLRHHLWRIQTVLAENEIAPFIEVSDDEVGVAPSADFYLDVNELEQAYWATKDKLGDVLEVEEYSKITAAIEKYGGELLPHSYDDWCIVERERLQSIYLILLDKLMVYCETHNRLEEGLIYGYRVLRIDLARECTHRRMMTLYYRIGDRTGALRQFQQCESILRQELNVPPSQKTIALHHEICADTGNRQTELENTISEPNVNAKTDFPQHLREINNHLVLLQQAIQSYLQHLN